MTELSIITVCFNAEKEIRATIESIINQTFKDFEYIIIDGASSDQTLHIIKEYIPTFKNMNVTLKIVSEPDKGIYDAMNKGISIANGTWINFMNAGDIFYSNNSLSNFFHTRIPQYVSYCFGDTLEIYTWGEMLFSKKKKKSRVMPFCHQSVFVRNEVMKKYKFNLQYRIISDYDLFYRLSKDNHKYEERSVIITKYDATNGISSRYPLSVDLELLKVHRIDTKWYYPLVIIKLYITRGIKNALKFILPRPLMTWIKLHTY